MAKQCPREDSNLRPTLTEPVRFSVKSRAHSDLAHRNTAGENPQRARKVAQICNQSATAWGAL